MTCAFCSTEAACRCDFPIPDAVRMIPARDVRHGDEIGIDEVVNAHSIRTHRGVVTGIEVVGRFGSLFRLQLLINGEHHSRDRHETALVKRFSPGSCAKPACDAHHADRGGERGIRCADHRRVA